MNGNGKQGPEPDPASRLELDRLEAMRRTPRRERTLTPTMEGTQAVNAEERLRQEERMQRLRDRLGAEKGVAERDFSLGSLKSRAKHDFDRSR